MGRKIKPENIIKRHERFLRKSHEYCLNQCGLADKSTEYGKKTASRYLDMATGFTHALTNLLRLMGNPTGELVRVVVNSEEIPQDD